MVHILRSRFGRSNYSFPPYSTGSRYQIGRSALEEAWETTVRVEIEGTYGEGGGQILRTAISLSAITGNPVRIVNVRGRRSPPGLRPQHETAVKALAHYVGADVRGLMLGSTEVEFFPQSLRPEQIVADTGTAGSTTLILQSLLPVMLFSGNRAQVEVRGGTNNPLAPQVDYVERVMIPTLMKMGPKVVLHLQRRGFYPRGGGILTVQSEPVDTLNPINLTEFGEIKDIDGITFSSRLPDHIVPRIIKAAQLSFEKADIWPYRMEREILQEDSPKCALSPGCGIVLTATSSSGVVLGADGLGKIKRPAEEVGRVTAENMIHIIGQSVPVDAHLADQLLLYMALAKGRSTIRVAEVTQHMLSCIYVCEQFLGPVFTVTNKTGPMITVSCDGVGFSVP